MSPDRNSSHIPFVKSQQGSMLVMAVFIIVIFGLLASALSSILSSSQDTVSYEVLGVRAQATANAGLEAGLYRVLRNFVACNVIPAASTPLTVAIDNTVVGLTQCNVSVTCNQRAAINGSSATYYILNSTGTCVAGNNKLTATRNLKAEVQK
jgi:MSHA biogenesis protein MshP